MVVSVFLVTLFVSDMILLQSFSSKFDEPYFDPNILKPEKKLQYIKFINGNQCPENIPWPCKVPGYCLSLDFICDGDMDCPDGYDEDRKMCIAKSRPPFEILLNFIRKYEKWLIPEYLGNSEPYAIAMQLTESPTINEYSKKIDLSADQQSNFLSLLRAINEERQIELIMYGMPPRAWTELSILFTRIIKSGFVPAIS